MKLLAPSVVDRLLKLPKTWQEIGLEAKVPVTTIWRVSKGERVYNRTVERIANYLGIPFDEAYILAPK